MKKLSFLALLCNCAIFFLCNLPFRAHAQIINTIAGTGTAGYSGDGGPATAATFENPLGTAMDRHGNLYVADADNYCIRKINSSGIITTVAGIPDSVGSTGDSGPATAARLHVCNGISVDTSDNLYIADTYNNEIRKVNSSGIIVTIAGTGISGYSGDGGPATAAKLNSPFSTVFDAAGNLYISDTWNNCIRKVNTSGTITTIAGIGTSGFSGDGGPATAAKFNWPQSAAFDNAGNMYICDYNNHRIRKVDTAGIVTTFAGTGYGGYSGDGGPAAAAQLSLPDDIVIDNAGNIYFGERGNNVIRKINTAGIISTFAGTGTSGSSGDGGPATAARLGNPSGLIMDAASNFYFSDHSYHRIRKINSCLPSVGPIAGPTSVCVGASITLTDTSSGGSWSSGYAGIATVNSGGVVTGVAPGNANIYYTVTNSCGSRSDTQVVTVIAQPNAGIISGADSVCVAYSITLAETVTGGSWSTSNATIATVNTSGFVTGVSAGSSVISYTVSNPCDTVSATHPLLVKPYNFCATGIDEKHVNSNLEIFPNPNNGVFTIVVPDGTTNEAIHVYDIYGRALTQFSTQNTGTYTKTINLTTLPKGTYVIKVVTSNATYQQKVIVW